MKKYTKKIAALLLILVLMGVGTFSIAPRQAHAQWYVFDGVGAVLNALQNVWAGAQTGLQSALGVKTFSLDKIATAIAKQILMQLTLSVVQWINSGFQGGGPAFVTNPSQFFQGLGDKFAGQFLQADGDLRFLCSPFSLDVRIALAVRMQNNPKDLYTCTLSSAITNATNAAKNASISGFVQGDFSQGGWPAFMELTTGTPNNAGGAFLKAESQLDQGINKKVNQAFNELTQGSGFLSSKNCTYTSLDAGDDGKPTTYTKAQYDKAQADPDSDIGDVQENCTTVTPGTTIANALDKAMNVPTDELELANDINAVINAAFSQLVIMTLKLGLSAVSGGSSGGASDYLAQIQSDAAANFKDVQSSTLQQITPYVGASYAVATTTQATLGLVVAVHKTYQYTVDCYTAAIASVGSATASYQLGYDYANSQINQVNQIIATQVAPLEAPLQGAAANASSTYIGLLSIQTSITNAQTPADLTAASTMLQTISNNASLPSQGDIQVAQNNYMNTLASTTPLQSDASLRLQRCQAFNIQTFPF